MATTEITKILFRRGTSSDRFALEGLGGLAQGEPGFTSSEGGAFGGDTSADNYNQDSAFLYSSDATQLAPGTTAHGGQLQKTGGGDFFIGGGGNADIFIGGTSAERHWQRYFVSKYGTDFNHPNAYIDGPLTVGASGANTTTDRAQNYKNHVWNVDFYGENGAVSWSAQTGQFNVTSTTALAIPSGATSDRPPATTNATLGIRRAGHIRWNTDTSKFEGWNGDHWGSLARPEDADQDTYVRAERTYGADNDQVDIVTGGTGRLTIGTTLSASVDMLLDSTGYLEIPNGTTNDRPTTSRQGMIRYNTSTNVASFEGYNGTTWQTFGGGVFGDKDNQTYVTCTQSEPGWSNGTGETTGTTGQIRFVVGIGTPRIATLAGYFDNGRNLFVRQDIVAYQSSDTRQKDNVRLIENSIEKVKMLRGVEFDWNDKGPSWVGDNRNDIGLLAQEVEAVIPQAVVDRDDGFKAVDYKKVIPLLVESIKELTARVEELESRQ